MTRAFTLNVTRTAGAMSDLSADARYLTIIIAGLSTVQEFVDRDPQWLGRLAGLSTRKTNAILALLAQSGRIELTRDCIRFAGFSMRKTPFFRHEKDEKNRRNFSGTTAEIHEFSRARTRGNTNLPSSEIEKMEGGELRAQAEIFYREQGLNGDDFENQWDEHCDEATRYRWDDERFAASWRLRVRKASSERRRADNHGTSSARQRRGGSGFVEAAADMLDPVQDDG